MRKRGRPRGLNVNPIAVEDMLAARCMSKSELAAAIGMSPSNLADLLHRQKGASLELIRSMATALCCRPETLAPELTKQFLAVRPGDPWADQLVGAVA